MSTTDTDCTCATDRDAHRCPMHSQADYDAQQMPAPDTERAEPLPNGVDALIDLLTARTVEVTRLTREVTRLDAVVTAVRELHQPETWEDDLEGTSGVKCVTCIDSNAEPAAYPCPTVRALGGGAR